MIKKPRSSITHLLGRSFVQLYLREVAVNLAEYKTEEQKRKFYKSGEWNKLRLKALERDNHECQQCKREGRVHVDSVKVEGERKSIELNVHHKYEIEDYPHLAFVLDNLETLCLNCHNKIHNIVFGDRKRKNGMTSDGNTSHQIISIIKKKPGTGEGVNQFFTLGGWVHGG